MSNDKTQIQTKVSQNDFFISYQRQVALHSISKMKNKRSIGNYISHMQTFTRGVRDAKDDYLTPAQGPSNPNLNLLLRSQSVN